MSISPETDRADVEGLVALFNPRLPVDAAQQGWIDRSLVELTELFGSADRWPTITPTAGYFPADFDGTDAAAQALVERICDWLHIDPGEVDLDLFADPADDGRAVRPVYAPSSRSVVGDYVAIGAGRGTLGIRRDDLTDPLLLVATISHELAHHLLISHQAFSTARPDNEGLTDLLTTHLGLGIMSANAQRRDRASYEGGWSSRSLGYLSAQTYGYALACRALAIGDPDPTWARFLAPNPLGYLRASLKVLNRESQRG